MNKSILPAKYLTLIIKYKVTLISQTIPRFVSVKFLEDNNVEVNQVILISARYSKIENGGVSLCRVAFHVEVWEYKCVL